MGDLSLVIVIHDWITADVLLLGTSMKSATAMFCCAQFRVLLQHGPFTQHLGSALFQPEFPRSFNGQGRHSLRGSFCV